MTNTAEQRPGIGHNHPPEDVSPAPYYVTYPELRPLGIPYSRKHLLDLMRRRLFPPAYQLSVNRVAWRYDEIIAYRESRPIARAALFQRKKGPLEPEDKSHPRGCLR
jgi:predicted DNA-binding transcriptional regulator AlpA